MIETKVGSSPPLVPFAVDSLLQRAGLTAEPSALFVRMGQTVRGITVHGDQALNAWLRLREIAPSEGFWPLLLGAPDELSYLEEAIEDAPEAAAILEEGAELYHGFRLAEERRARPEPAGPGPVIARWMERHPSGGDPASLRSELSAVREELVARQMPDSETPFDASIAPQDGFTVTRDVLSGAPLPEVVLALLPTPLAYAAPVWLNFGAWNDCPRPAEHVARLRRWEERFGAEVVAISHDVVELRVLRPPTTPTACVALAREHYDYCGDIVHQGFGSLARLAGSLLGARAWYFWWD